MRPYQTKNRQIKNFSQTVNNMKKQTTKQEKLFKNHKNQKGLKFKILSGTRTTQQQK